MLRIGDLAKRTGISVEAIRYYERCRLLDEPQRTANGYRTYPNTAIKQINFILKAKSLGFSLNDISELLSLCVSREISTCGEVKLIAELKLAEIEQKIANLQQIQGALMDIVESCVGGNHSATNCTILEALESQP